MLIKTILQFLIIAVSFPTALSALSAFPMKITVQGGDTISFTPIIKGWDSTVTSVSVELSEPGHGRVQFIPDWFDSNSYYKTARSAARTAPPHFPGLRYIPDLGYIGRDYFTFKIKTSKDSTEIVRCDIRITPVETNGMTVLLVVNQALLQNIQSEVERLKQDLIREGYSSRILPWTLPATWNTSNAKELWDTLVAEYDNPARMLAGAIMIGELPYYSSRNMDGSSEGSLVKTSAYWCMSMWQADMDADTTINGLLVNMSTYGGLHFTPAFMNIWISNMYAAKLPQLGDEVELTKRMLQNNHDYRTGISRLPRVACSYDQYPVGANGRRLDPKEFLDIWPAYSLHLANDSTHPFKSDFKRGGELWQINTHAAPEKYTAVYKSMSGTTIWTYKSDARFYNTIFPFRFFLSNNCKSAEFGKITNQHLLTKNSSCVLAIATTDYYNWGGVLNERPLSPQPPTDRFHAYIAKGERWGKATIRSNMHLWSRVFHGDLSLKPKMGPSNTKPVISSLSAVKGEGMSWTFTVTASDQDTNDGITSIDWYGTSYNSGKASPDSSSLSNTFSKTYTAAALCTVRVEVADNYKARDYSEVIIKTDSGVVSTNIYTESETKHPSDAGRTLLSVCPNPFNPETQISVSLSSRSNILLKVFMSDGTLVSTIANKRLEAGEHSFTWNGSGYPTGIYILKLSTNNRSETCKLILTK